MDDHILLSHGGGGAKTQELIQTVFAKHFANPNLTSDDAAVLTLNQTKLAFSTDGFIVSPYFFPGGDIGKLSICGTVNDLACMGAKPLWLTTAFVIEEGFPTADLETIATSMEKTAQMCGVSIVAGDTKVANKGQVDKIFITTSGVGSIEHNIALSGANAQDGDTIIVTGDIGRHGCAILLAREEFGIEADVTSDCAPLWHLVEALCAQGIDLHVIRDATRGGVGTVLYEIAAQSKIGICIQERNIPQNPQVMGVCSLLGLDPLYLACEGRLVIIAPKAQEESILSTLRTLPNGEGAKAIGIVSRDIEAGCVAVETVLGAKTRLPKPTGELLPRIC